MTDSIICCPDKTELDFRNSPQNSRLHTKNFVCPSTDSINLYAPGGGAVIRYKDLQTSSTCSKNGVIRKSVAKT